jgi:uncharacterized RDD family membrane protein YckC
MNTLKKWMGLVWILLALAAMFFLIKSAFYYVIPDGKTDISNPLPWIIIITIFTPIAAGLALFGWYAFKGEYNKPIE